MHFTRDPVTGRSELDALDDQGIIVSYGKDQALMAPGTACGVELHNGTVLRPNLRNSDLFGAPS